MGASSSIAENESAIPDSVLEIHKICEELKTEIAMKDARFIHEQTIHNWKDHNHLIEMLR
jgi:hypothetical protein